MNEEEIKKILLMKEPEYERDGICIFPNAAGNISISSDRLCREDLVCLDVGHIEEICEVMLAFAKWLKRNTTPIDFIKNKAQKGDQQ